MFTCSLRENSTLGIQFSLEIFTLCADNQS